MQFWNEIVNTAVLGTEKKPVSLATLPSPLQEAAAIIVEHTATDKEEQFLQLAALGLNFRRSGSKPPQPSALLFPEAPPETRPYCPPRATQIAKDILAEDNVSLLAYWLDHCVQAQKLTSPELVPTLLNRAVNHKNIQQATAIVCGKRGEWLGRFNSAWTFSAAEDQEELWQTGTPDQRKIVLWRMRQKDPAKTREWLLQTWPQENANSKAELLKQLDGTVQDEDEPWLTDLLAEKSQKVKDEAQNLIKQLPTSALVKRYVALIQPLIVLKKEKALLGMMTKTSLQIQMPVIPEKGEYVPGIDKLSNDKYFTDGEFVLFQLMQSIPPTFWEEQWALPPKEIFALFTGKNEKYLPAFMKATVRFRDQKWAQAYLEYREVFYPELLDLLEPAQQDAYCLKHFKHNADGIIQHARQWDREWSLALANEIVDHTARHPYQYNISFYKTNIHRIPAGVASHLERFGPTDPIQRQHWINLIDEIGRLLGLKEQTKKIFNE